MGGNMSRLIEFRDGFAREAESCASLEEIEALRLKYLGRKGLLAQFRKNVDFKALPPEERGTFGKTFNDIKDFMENTVSTLKDKLNSVAAVEAKPALDMSLPGSDSTIGALHPVTLVQQELEDIFMSMGFFIDTGYHIEEEFYNFDAVNIPFDHPAREMQDTFWLTDGHLLRTHTSANQVRALKKFGAPIRAIFPGRCFRYEVTDATHDNTFYQLEGLMVDRDISVAHLISVMKILLSQVFHRDVTVRLRPGYFPFVEPGFELDIKCLICGGAGCKSCKNAGWLELLPCGLVHPNVLRFGGVDPDEWSGFAFGLGMTRLAMMKYGIPDIRLFNSGDIRFLEQFTATV